MTGTDNPFSVSDIYDGANHDEDDFNESFQSSANDSFITDEEEIGEGSESFDNMSVQSNRSESYTPLSHHEMGNLHASLSRVKRRLFASNESVEVKSNIL